MNYIVMNKVYASSGGDKLLRQPCPPACRQRLLLHIYGTQDAKPVGREWFACLQAIPFVQKGLCIIN